MIIEYVVGVTNLVCFYVRNLLIIFRLSNDCNNFVRENSLCMIGIMIKFCSLEFLFRMNFKIALEN